MQVERVLVARSRKSFDNATGDQWYGLGDNSVSCS